MGDENVHGSPIGAFVESFPLFPTAGICFFLLREALSQTPQPPELLDYQRLDFYLQNRFSGCCRPGGEAFLFSVFSVFCGLKFRALLWFLINDWVAASSSSKI